MSQDLVLEGNSESISGLVIIHGISSRPFGTPFDDVVEELSKDYSIVRINA